MKPAALVGLLFTSTALTVNAAGIREVEYSPKAIIDVTVARGVALLIELPDGDLVRFAGVGRSSECNRSEDNWCVSTPQDTNLVFVKAKTRASGSNNLELVTARNLKYSFRLNLGDERSATQRLVVRPAGRGPSMPMAAPTSGTLPAASRQDVRGAAPDVAASVPAFTRATAIFAGHAPPLTEAELLADRLAAAPRIANSSYSLAIGSRSEDIVPTAVFDDGVFTYLRLPGNREIPAVFHVAADGQETLTNTRMESDLLVVDRVSRTMRLRLGDQVISVINEAFDLEGRSVNKTGMTVDGVERALRSASGSREAPR
jgi:type IV secretion system protein VirB9